MLVLSINTASALEPLPSNLIPMKESLSLRYAPNFETTCISSKNQKLKTDLFGSNETTKYGVALFQDSGNNLKIKFKENLDDDVFTFLAEIKSDGSGLSEKEPIIEFKTSTKINDEDLQNIKSALAPTFKKTFKNEIGTTIKQDSKIKIDWCNLMNVIPGINFRTAIDDFSVKGLSNINGRDSVVVSGVLTCNGTLKNTKASLQIKGWYAIDIQSGLEITNHYETILETKDISGTEKQDVVCDIKGQPSQRVISTTPPVLIDLSKNIDKSASQRLTELKELFDKNLITKEIFEQKRNEIVNNL